MDWARSLRIDASPTGAMRNRVAAAFLQTGVRAQVSGSAELERTYVLLEGPQGVDPAELEERIPEARWYGEAIIALAIEPTPADALPMLAEALGGAGRPAGVAGCDTLAGRVVVEFRPAVTQPALLVRIADVELRRFSGYRRIELLSPLPASVAAEIAASGLQAAEIGTDRILESLLERAHVE